MFLPRADDRRSRAAGIQIARRFCILTLVAKKLAHQRYYRSVKRTRASFVDEIAQYSAAVYNKDAAVGLWSCLPKCR